MILNIFLSIFQSVNYLIEYLFKGHLNEKKFYKENLKDKKIIVLDIGSNVGTYIKLITKTFKEKELEIHSFEPIKRLIDKQKAKNAILIKNNVLVSNSSGKEVFFERKISSQSSIFNKENMGINEVIKTYDVVKISVDEYILNNNVEKIDILKIDVEGNELQIIKALENIFTKKIIKIIKIESSVAYFSDNIQIQKILNHNNYDFIGTTNNKYVKNNILIWDSYFILRN